MVIRRHTTILVDRVNSKGEARNLLCSSVTKVQIIKLSKGAMAMGSIYAAVPAVAAAVGFYFIDKNYVKEIKQGVSVSNQKMTREVKEQVKTLKNPKLAPQLDGLHCFETMVMK
ncbi:hypothetical protein RJT34_01010 [Clitoria ternatea]|uniref:Uncharacterized protein n=1 Tax=Clitoria ternatea TaxID=43366 RepID=A0AAN9KFU5_CLITE